jgi:acetyl esterase/lipase
MTTSLQVQTPNSEQIKTEFDVEFGRAQNIPLLLDIYHPPASFKPPYASVVWIHGGGWHKGDKRLETVVKNSDFFARAGFFTISINYRLSDVAKFPAPLQDCKCAIRWLRANAKKYQLDPSRIGAGGRSAGGHLALLLGTTDQEEFEGDAGHPEQSSAVKAVCSWAGPADLTRPPHVPDGPRTGLVGKIFEQDPEAFKRASPVAYASNKSVPTLLIHSEVDEVVPFGQSELMLQALKEKQADCSLIRVKNAKHVFGALPDKVMEPSVMEIHQATADFFKRHL